MSPWSIPPGPMSPWSIPPGPMSPWSIPPGPMSPWSIPPGGIIPQSSGLVPVASRSFIKPSGSSSGIIPGVKPASSIKAIAVIHSGGILSILILPAIWPSAIAAEENATANMAKLNTVVTFFIIQPLRFSEISMNISLMLLISADRSSLHKFEMNVLQQFQTSDSTWPAKWKQ